VSKVAVALMRVHITGYMFIAMDIARTRSLSNRIIVNSIPHEDWEYTLNIAIRRPHVKRLNSKNIPYNFSGPAKFGNDLFVRLSSKCRMAPGMNSNLVTSEILLLKKAREGSHSGTHDKESGFEVRLVQIIEEVRGVISRTIVVCKTPLVFLGASGDIFRARATTASPPATARVSRRRRVRRASTSDISTKAWD
jgi:hypothetical protein